MAEKLADLRLAVAEIVRLPIDSPTHELITALHTHRTRQEPRP